MEATKGCRSALSRFYRLSAICQPRSENVVAGARNYHYLQLWRLVA